MLFLIKHGADPTLPALDGTMPFDATDKLSAKKYVKLTGQLVALQTDFGDCFCRLLAVGDQQLFVASCEGNASEVQRLVESEGMSVTATSHDGLTALHVACKERKLDVVKVLIEKGAAVNHQVIAEWRHNVKLHSDSCVVRLAGWASDVHSIALC